VQKLVVVSLTVCAHVRSRKILGDAEATPPWEGRGWPAKTRYFTLVLPHEIWSLQVKPFRRR